MEMVSKEPIDFQCLTSLGDLVFKVFDSSLVGWYDHAKLVDCICNFVLLRRQLAQLVINKLLMLLQNPDYQIRLCLARRIGVLFQTWDGHSELFQDHRSGKNVTAVQILEGNCTRSFVCWSSTSSDNGNNCPNSCASCTAQ